MAAIREEIRADSSPADPWLNFARADTTEQWCQGWLSVLCTGLLRGARGLLLLRQPDGSYAPAAAVPAQDLSHLADIATEALRSREGVVRREIAGPARLAYPFQTNLAAGTADGAVVIELIGGPDAAAVERASRLLHWGIGWLLDLLHRQAIDALQQRNRHGAFALDSVLAMLSEPTERQAGFALVNRLARHFGCHQVQLAVAKRHKLRVLAMSHAAWFDDRAEIVHLALQAMHEAYDQRQRIAWPDTATGSVAVAHKRYAEQAGSGALCSLPLVADGGVAGVLLLERDRAFEPAELELLDSLAMALAPVLELRHEAAIGATQRALRSGRRSLAWLTGTSKPALKLGLGAGALVLLLLALVPAPFRVSSQAIVEGSVQRAAVAPFEGYLREAPARAGDLVKAGQVLALLEDKDLRLERDRWEAELELASRKEREAMAKGNRVDQRLAAAQANQARAQLDLALSKLERIAVTAPFDGVVVKGDLSQQLGSPVELGKVLFELAPLESWRVILKVDERDIGHVRVGAAGEIVLSSLPGQSWPLKVKKLTPVSVAEEGRNYFRVEAELGGTEQPRLRPNMEGVAKVEAGRSTLLWIWTRPLVDWARLQWWKLLP